MQRYQQQLQALGSDILLTVVSDESNNNITKIFKKLTASITAFEKRFSRFLTDSELTKFNNRAGERVETNQKFHALLTAVASFADNTRGLYNPFVLPALQQAGYLASWLEPHKVEKLTDFRKGHVVPANNLEISKAWARIPAETSLDFGGIGKGYLLDQLANFLDTQKIGDYWLSLGGDIICNGFDINGQAWKVGVVAALNPGHSIDELTNDGNKLAIATSGVIKRRGVKKGKAWHHIIDPRTAKPADTDILTATVTANSATVADVYAKCLVILGSTKAVRFAATRKLSYLLQVATPNSVKIIKNASIKFQP